VLDVEHSGTKREMLGRLVLAATQRALDAWWDFLTAVDRPAAVPTTA
jgi:hypothetical protein